MWYRGLLWTDSQDDPGPYSPSQFMIDPQNVPGVEFNEVLARFVLSSSHIRNSDNTIKSDAFIPHPYTDLSVTRHRDAAEAEIWNVGAGIAAFQRKTLHGRGDVLTSVFLERGLKVLADPMIGDAQLPDNPNHANVTGWPANDKARQKLIALEVASQTKLVRVTDFRA